MKFSHLQLCTSKLKNGDNVPLNFRGRKFRGGTGGRNHQQLVRSDFLSREVVGDRASTVTEALWSVLSVLLKFTPGVHHFVPPHTHSFCPTVKPLLNLWWHWLCPPKWTAGGKIILSLNLYTLSHHLTFLQVSLQWNSLTYSSAQVSWKLLIMSP